MDINVMSSRSLRVFSLFTPIWRGGSLGGCGFYCTLAFVRLGSAGLVGFLSREKGFW